MLEASFFEYFWNPLKNKPQVFSYFKSERPTKWKYEIMFPWKDEINDKRVDKLLSTQIRVSLSLRNSL